MKKNTTAFLSGLLLTIFISTSVLSQDIKVTDKTVADTSIRYKDGTYEGKITGKI
jgi:uncharacterized protein with FMN-binding domain